MPSERKSTRTFVRTRQRTLPIVSCHILYTTDNPARYFSGVLAKTNWDIGAKLSYFLATGNLVSPTGLDLQQTSGYTIVAEKLNFYRYLSHFRCIHRGAFFAELKTTTVRKLLPESWGGCRWLHLCGLH